jgi:hypothetical protein
LDLVVFAPNKAFQGDAIAVSHLLQKAQKLRHGNSAPEQRRYAARAGVEIAFASSFGDAPNANNDFKSRSIDTLGSPASILAMRD